MHRTCKSIISSSLFFSLFFLPALTTAAEDNTAGQNQGNPRNTNNTQTHPSTQQNWSNNQGWSSTTSDTSNPQGWGSNQGRSGTQQGMASQQNWRSNQGFAYDSQSWGHNPSVAFDHQGWSGARYYSAGQPGEHYMGGSYSNPGYTYYSSGHDMDNDGVVEPWEQNYSYSPGFQSARGRYYSSANSNYPNYSHYSYSYPTNNYDRGYDDNSYPYSQSYPDGGGVGAGVYFNVR